MFNGETTATEATCPEFLEAMQNEYMYVIKERIQLLSAAQNFILWQKDKVNELIMSLLCK